MMGSVPAGVGALSLLAELAAPFRLAAKLFARHWPQLLLAATLGMLAHDLLLLAAVETGLANPLAGMVVLSLVVLAKLVATVVMLMLLRPDLPAVRSLRRSVDAETAERETGDLLPLVAVAILPFFAYYAAWGFLGDTVREYSRLGLAKAPLGEGGDFLNVLRSSWLLVSIAICWAIRWAVKRMRGRSKAAIWPLLIVACDATWIFIGLYGISVWQDELMRWIGSGNFLRALPDLQGVDAMLSMQAWAAGEFIPVELQGPGVAEEARRLFFFTLLPLVWLVMTAIVYGYDLSPQKKDEHRTGPQGGVLKWLTDFIAHFVEDYRNRYMPVFRSVVMALKAGLPALVALVVGYRLISYIGAWAWVGAFGLVGEHEFIDMQLIADGIGLLFGSPSDQTGGILLEPMRICLLAAVFELAVAGSIVRKPDSAAAPAAG